MSNEIRNPGFSAKDPRETIIVGFNFSALTTAPTTPVVTAARHSGEADASPSDILDGDPTVSGARVLQAITGGVTGTDYVLTCQVDIADGSRFILSGVLPVRAA